MFASSINGVARWVPLSQSGGYLLPGQKLDASNRARYCTAVPQDASDRAQTPIAADKNDRLRAGRIVIGTLTAVGGASAVFSPQASGHETVEWLPRRHYRGIKEPREAPKFERVPASTHVDRCEGVSVSGAFSHFTDTVKSAVGDVGDGFSMKASKSSQQPSRVSLAPSTASHAAPSPVHASSVPSTSSDSKWTVWIAIAIGLGLIGVLIGKRNSAKQQQNGRWVRDRSLGGKMVFIPDDAPAPRPRGSSVASPLADVEEERPATSGRSLSEGRTLPRQRPDASASRRSSYKRPEWWTYAPGLPTSEAAKLAARQRAKKAIKALEDDKLVRGQDYDVLGLVRLYQICKEGDCDIASAVSTDAGRDAMLRSAVREAIKTAAGSTNLVAVTPRSFVCGLSRYLGVTEDRAVTITHAVLAADLRARLLALAAAARSGRAERVRMEKAQLQQILGVFPLPADAPEAVMVGAALRDNFTVEEMERLLKELAVEQSQYMALYAVLLGFDLSFTLPILEQYVTEAQQSAS